ncbi:MAG TPA: sce7726 family protein [Candidatus Paceibacterota bacterium]|jgi:hypothetical protein
MDLRDRDFRSALKSNLSTKKFVLDDPTCLILDELGLCQGSARIDVAVLNGQVHGYEIKSDLDTLERVDVQLSVYEKIFDRLTFVVGKKHLESVQLKIPAWCGITLIYADAKGQPKVKPIRSAKVNKTVDPYSLVQLLWRDETINILRTLGKAQGMENKPRRVLWDHLATETSPSEINRYVRETLKARQGWRSATSPA